MIGFRLCPYALLLKALSHILCCYLRLRRNKSPSSSANEVAPLMSGNDQDNDDDDDEQLCMLDVCDMEPATTSNHDKLSTMVELET